MRNAKLVRKIRSLTTFEMMFESSESNKKKWISLKAGYEYEDVEDLAEIMSLLAKSFNKTLKRFNKKSYSGEEGSDTKVSNFIAFTSKISIEEPVNPTAIDHPSNNISDDEEELTKEELMGNYQMLFMKWSKLTKTYTTGATKRSVEESRTS
ncbi:hypothetical protein LIER_37679 [Lithospermum erythrorhizon]|uniref:Uncharacterized protein n=1 Tax=Lithospermum erythrorhizon TaxID=34254 RepID=A0AAV3PR01_LITER